jgi:hypothetical protein
MKFIEKPANALSIKRRGLVCGIGVNDAPYMVVLRLNGRRYLCPYYRVWQNMIERCYGRATQKRCPTYVGCSVADEWLRFMTFRRWMEEQDWAGKELDKDILSPGNSTYSAENCVFVTKQVNQLLCDSAGSRGDLPIGVSRRGKRFIASIGGKGKRYLGMYDTPQAANAAYRDAKANYLRRVAKDQPDNLRSALIHHADLLAA